MGQDVYWRRSTPVAAVFCLSLGLSGCIAAIPLIAYGSMAVEGFMAYKTVQTASGGSVEIKFPGKDGKTAPAEPIAPVARIAVWPGSEAEVRFTERLQSSGKFTSVVSPAAVSAILTDTKTPADLSQLTDTEQSGAFDTVCRHTHADFVFAAHAHPASTDANVFSFSRPNATFKVDLFGYSCAQHQIAWRDLLLLIINAGTSSASSSEMLQAGGDAWADRVFEAMGGPKAAS